MDLEVVGSRPIFHPIVGYRQVVRHGILIPAFVGSNPATPAINPKILGYRQAVRLGILIPACEGSNPSTPATKGVMLWFISSVGRALDF